MTYMVYTFSFHLSGLCPYDDDHRAMDALLSMCINRGYTFKVRFNQISAVDRSACVDVHLIPEREARLFYRWAWYER